MTGHRVVFPMTTSYRSNWGAWDMIREFCQEMIDLHALGWTIGQNEDGETIIKGRPGPGWTPMVPQNLLFGCDSAKGDDKIGRFREGSKLAFLVALRLGIAPYLHSGPYLYRATVEDEPGLGEVMVIYWEEVPEYEGSRYTLVGYTGDAYRTRFVFPGDDRIVWENVNSGVRILKETPTSIYAKGVWVGTTRMIFGTEMVFSYDLADITLGEDRGIPNSWSVYYSMGKAWADCTDVDLLVEFWQAVADRQGEQSISGGKNPRDSAAHQKAFEKVFGGHAVVRTDDDSAREATHRGANPVYVPSGARQLVTAVPDDRKYTAMMEGASAVKVDEKKLDQDEKKILSKLRKLAEMIIPGTKVLPYLFAESIVAGQHKPKELQISRTRLANMEMALDTMIHELAHEESHGAADNTEAMTQALSRVGARLLALHLLR